MKVNRRKLLSVLGVSPALLVSSPVLAEKAKKEANGGGGKFTAVSPKGTPPPLQLYSMAPRVDTLDGKTVFLLDQGFFGGDLLLAQMQGWFARNMPKTKVIFKRKEGPFQDDEPKLWAEMKAKADVAIIAIGH